MKLSYNGCAIDELGEFTVSQAREYEDGQRARVSLKVVLTLFERSYAENYALVQQLRKAVRTQQAVLQWTNDETGEDYVNQTASVASDDLPEEWGTYQMTFNLVFQYYEQDVVTNNLPLVFSPTGGAGQAVTLGHMTRFTETLTTERFSPYHGERSVVRGKVVASGYLLVEATLPLEERRKALVQAKNGLQTACVQKEGAMAFGEAFNRVVRVEELSCELDQLRYAVNWSFTASYTVFPDEAKFATVEFEAAQREAFEPATGEQFLTLTGKVTATDEAGARAKLEEVAAAVVKQYGYGGGQLWKNESAARQANANQDGAVFIELSFTREWRRFRAGRLGASFEGLDLGDVRLWDLKYSARRFSDLHAQRQYAGGQVAASGTWVATNGSTEGIGRADLQAKADALQAAVNRAEGTLVYGGFKQKVRISNSYVMVNQAETGVDWTLEANWSVFPDESGYAVVEYTVAQASNAEDGEETLTLSGTILAPDEGLARAKLDTLRGALLSQYGYNLAQQLRPQATVRSVDADKDGKAFIELSFAEEYRRRRADLMSWTMTSSSRSDTASGLVTSTYSGQVVASGATVDAAYAAALVKASSLGSGTDVLTQLGSTAFLRSSQITWERRQVQANNNVEFVRLQFAYEYQSKMAAGNAYLEVTTDRATQAFGSDVTSVSGHIVAADAATAQALYQREVRNAYNGRLIEGERLQTAEVRAQREGGWVVEAIRLEFGFAAFEPKPAGSVTYRYAISTSNDYLTLTRRTEVRGSAFARDAATAAGAVAKLLKALAPEGALPLRDESGEDHEYTSDSGTDVLVKYDFSASYEGRITGEKGLLEMRLSESVRYSGVRWVVQPIPRDGDGTGGVSIAQDGGLTEGSRTVRGTVTATSLAAAEAWARQQRALLTGDKDGTQCPLPAELEREYEFVPRVDGVAVGHGQNVRLWRVNFVFGEILPNYPEPQ